MRGRRSRGPAAHLVLHAGFSGGVLRSDGLGGLVVLAVLEEGERGVRAGDALAPAAIIIDRHGGLLGDGRRALRRRPHEGISSRAFCFCCWRWRQLQARTMDDRSARLAATSSLRSPNPSSSRAGTPPAVTSTMDLGERGIGQGSACGNPLAPRRLPRPAVSKTSSSQAATARTCGGADGV
ncbi:hypothetical protein ZWY2020_001368 [Hordeum vulgare]|nr:hypothetical protein ZWY2020_001368 [Hordeum vulgare]